MCKIYYNDIENWMKIVYFLIPFFVIYSVVIVLYLNDNLTYFYKEEFENGVKDTSLEMATKDEISLNTQVEKYRNSIDDNYEKITDPVSDVYLPYSDSTFEDVETDGQEKLNEFTIINVYKNLLGRQPKPEELKKIMKEFNENKVDEEILKMRVYNSTEYKMIVKMQSNDVDAGLVSTISEVDLIEKIRNMYKENRKTEAVSKILLPLKDCYIHLQFNDYLFRAMLVHDNYGKFEEEIMEARMLSREKMLELFNKYFLLSELRLVANEFKKQDMMKRHTNTIPQAVQTATIGSEINSSNVNLGVDGQIAEIVKDGNNIFNINIVLGEDVLKSKAYSEDDKRRVYNEHGNINENVCKTAETTKIYDPINYKQHYRGDMRYRPNVCSYGTKQIVQPIFLNSQTLFQGTELKEAIENTQVGSIMPKFEYREYEEVK
jgi:hypothetical protein